MRDQQVPILVGGAQLTQQDVDPREAKGPVDMMAEVARRAADDAGLGTGGLAKADSLRMVEFLSGIYLDPIAVLAERLGMTPGDKVDAGGAGNTPQLLVNNTAQDLADGTIKTALLCGAETLDSFINAMQVGITPDWVERDGAEFSFDPPEFDGTAEFEVPYGLQLPVNVYPLFESALRARDRLDLVEHRKMLGELFSPFSHKAAQNPYAWFKKARSPEEISTISGENRLVGFPYTKYMNAIIRVDQAAAVIMTTVAEARRLGINPSRWVYLHGCANANDHWFFTERENFHSSPAIGVIGRKALEMAQMDLSDIDYFDLYSCFPSAVQIARDELGIDPGDSRTLTVTGGLPYHGGPGNNYAMHAIATIMNLVRKSPGTKGLCSALGWYTTKHAIGIYSNEPVDGPWKREDPAVYQAEIAEGPKTEVVIEASGHATIEAYTVTHGRSGPERGIVAGRLDDGRRFLALTPNDADIYAELMAREGVGRTGKVTPGPKTNTFEPD